jgi:hypothetical protein
MTFIPGQSGNPAGRPKGSVNRQLAMLREAADQVIPALIARARAGDIEAAKLILDRGVPKLKPVSPPETFTLPGGGLLAQVRGLLQQAAAGEVSACGAEEMLHLLASAAQVVIAGRKAGATIQITETAQQSSALSHTNLWKYDPQEARLRAERNKLI